MANIAFLTLRQIQFVSGSALLKFHVVIEREANGRHKLSAECLGMAEPCLATTRCLASRPHANDLRHLLVCLTGHAIRMTGINHCRI